MYNLGEFQKLTIKRFKNNGAYIGLKDIKNEKMDILLPKKEVLEKDSLGDEIIKQDMLQLDEFRKFLWAN